MNHAILVVIIGLDVLIAVLTTLFQLLDTAPPAPATTPSRALPFGVGLVAPNFAQPAHALAEIDVDAPVVDEHRIHLGVGVLAALSILKLNERIL